MPYQSLPSRAMPYNTDGSVVKIISTIGGVFSLSSNEMAELNDEDYNDAHGDILTTGTHYMVVFFPEPRTVLGLFALARRSWSGPGGPILLEGSTDSTNGLDGSWESANAPSGYNGNSTQFDEWRKSVKPVSFSQAVRVIRIKFCGPEEQYRNSLICHVYGVKGSGQTPDDILFLDAEASDAEFTNPLDFGDRPAGTSTQHQIKIKNASTTKTANNINLYVEDPADIIRIAWSSSGPWQTTLNVASLASNTKSSVIYVKCETPAPPTPLGPRRAPIRVSVGSWS